VVCAELTEQNSAVGPTFTGSLLANRYEILQLIGQGGTSLVYKALDRLTGDIVAIKLLSSGCGSDKSDRESFRQEVSIARKLAHSNIVRIYDLAVHDDACFISMELVEGRDLGAVLRDKRTLNGADFLSVFSQLWSALEHIHASGIIHRDIKLRNLMLTVEGKLKLMDFGIAQDLTNARTVIWAGTPGYIAPELLAGVQSTVRSDIYAAGLVCFELLTGNKPFLERRTDAQIDALAAAAGIPSDLIRLLQRCIDPDPSRRPESAASILSEAAEILKAPARAPQRAPARRRPSAKRAIRSTHQFNYRSAGCSRYA
jgi:serine/threonine protein kinase